VEPGGTNLLLIAASIIKTVTMATRKNNNPAGLEEDRNASGSLSTENNRINDEDTLDTRFVSHDVEEGDEDYDDEELTEADFAVDELDEEGDEEDV
jgi:hypothetical protein